MLYKGCIRVIFGVVLGLYLGLCYVGLYWGHIRV